MFMIGFKPSFFQKMMRCSGNYPTSEDWMHCIDRVEQVLSALSQYVHGSVFCKTHGCRNFSELVLTLVEFSIHRIFNTKIPRNSAKFRELYCTIVQKKYRYYIQYREINSGTVIVLIYRGVYFYFLLNVCPFLVSVSETSSMSMSMGVSILCPCPYNFLFLCPCPYSCPCPRSYSYSRNMNRNMNKHIKNRYMNMYMKIKMNMIMYMSMFMTRTCTYIWK